jgi:hypothetical protein
MSHLAGCKVEPRRRCVGISPQPHNSRYILHCIMEIAISKDFALHTGNYYADRSDYDNVNVLLIFWKDDDLNTGKELTEVRMLFGADFKFHVAASYPLPSDGTQQARLRSEVAKFIEEYALNKRSLSIIYYTGHCREVNGEAEWTALVPLIRAR